MLKIKSLPQPEKPAEALEAVVELREIADKLEKKAVKIAIEKGWTWAQIAKALGVTRQAAHKRYAGTKKKDKDKK